jgi:ubiquitin-protein ligase
MTGQETRIERLERELRLMQLAQRESSILRFVAEGVPPSRYRIRLTGTSSHPDYINEHELDIWLGMNYPAEAPEVRFVTMLFHPNIERSGRVSLADCGIVWSHEVTLDRLCKALWDIARYARIELNSVVNSAAERWFREQREIALPVDHRELCDLREMEWGEVQHRAIRPEIDDEGITFIE